MSAYIDSVAALFKEMKKPDWLRPKEACVCGDGVVWGKIQDDETVRYLKDENRIDIIQCEACRDKKFYNPAQEGFLRDVTNRNRRYEQAAREKKTGKKEYKSPSGFAREYS